MMQYLCLIAAEKVMEHMTPDDAAAHYEEYRVYTENLRANGQFVTANRLIPADQAVTVRLRDGKILKTDGPFAETKEQIGGFYVLEAADLNAAIQLAARIPGASRGCVEVRPIADDAQTRRCLGLT